MDLKEIGVAIDHFLDGNKSEWTLTERTHRDCGGKISVITATDDDRWPGYMMGICNGCPVIATLDNLLERSEVGPQPPRPHLKWPTRK